MYNPVFDEQKCPRLFHGNYRGRVINTSDPLDAGRVQVRVYGVYDGVTDSDLPWAIFADPFMGGQEGFGGYFVPDIGNDVWVFFEQGDHMLPVYFAGAPARPHGPEEKGTPTNRVLRTRAGHVIELDDSDGNNRIHIHHSSGTDIVIDDDGNIEEYVVGNIKRTIEGNVTEIIEGSFTTDIDGSRTEHTKGQSIYKADGRMYIEGSRIDINEG